MSKQVPIVYNTLHRKKEKLLPQDNQIYRIYSCGPTVYDFAHIGNFRTYVFCDLFRRTLKYLGWKVEHVMNITDVDDKTIRRSNESKISLKEYTQKYTRHFFEDLESLNIEQVEHVPKATEWIEPMCKMIASLIDNDVAYQGSDGSIYFKITRFHEYGALSHFNLEDLEQGASDRVSHDEYDKDNASDFVLWKAYDKERDGDVFWDSPFGKGRPGWHIECSVMATELLGKTIDVHLGGVDLVFPHHENEIAQCEACYHQQFSRFWLHVEHLLVDNKKMSKSLGNFYTLRDLLDKGYKGKEIRYLLLSNHYRTQFNFTIEGLKGARHALTRLQSCVDRIMQYKGSLDSSIDIELVIKKAVADFDNALIDDFNISVALAAIFTFIKDINAWIDSQSISQQQSKALIDFFKRINTVLGCLTFEEVSNIPDEITELINARVEAKKAKDYALADELRITIQKKGFDVIDTPQGPKAVVSSSI